MSNFQTKQNIKIFFKNFIIALFSYIYKLVLFISLFLIIVTASFYVNFIEVDGYNFDAVLKLDLLLFILILFGYGIIYIYKHHHSS